MIDEPEAPVPKPGLGALRRALAWMGMTVGLLGFLGLQWAQSNPEWVERHYSGSLFPRIREQLGELSRLSSGSLAERGIVLLAIWVLVLLVKSASRLRRGTHSLGTLLRMGVLRVLGLVGWGYAAFLLCWGFNHARLPYAQLAGLELQAPETEVQELGDLLEFLVEECNRLRPLFHSNDLNLKGADGAADPRLLQGYAVLAERVPELGGPDPVFRKPLSSALLTRLGITGIYSPFTAEAHLNDEVPLWSQPFSACHEVAHARGFAREDEANFIAWLVCRASGDAAFAYSGAYVALAHASRALGAVDAKRRSLILKGLTRFVLEDQALARKFWKAKHSVVTEVSQSTNNIYLKTQGQASGIQSYGRMIELMLAEWRQGAGQLPAEVR